MSEYIVRDSWDTGHADHSASSLREARSLCRKLVKEISQKCGFGEDNAREFVKIYELTERSHEG